MKGTETRTLKVRVSVRSKIRSVHHSGFFSSSGVGCFDVGKSRPCIFLSCEEIDHVVVVLQPERIDLGIDMIKKYGWELRVRIVAGGERRQDSVCNGLKTKRDNP